MHNNISEIELKQFLDEPAYLKEHINKIKSSQSKITFLNCLEVDCNKAIEVINASTNPLILKVGNFYYGQNAGEEWKHHFIFNEPTTPAGIRFDKQNFNLRIEDAQKLADLWNTNNFLPKLKQNDYLKTYSFEINQISRIFDIINFIQSAKKLFENYNQSLDFKGLDLIPSQKDNYEKAISPVKHKQIDRIKQLAEKEGLVKGKSVPSKTVEKILRELQKEKLTKTNSQDAIRKQLNRLGYSREL